MDNETMEALRDSIDKVAELSLMFYRATEDHEADEDEATLLLSVFMGTLLYHE